MKQITIGIISFLSTFYFTIFGQNTTLIKLDTYDISDYVEEPSGLAFDGEFLYLSLIHI